MTDATDDAPEPPRASATPWPSEDGSSYAVHRRRDRWPWLLPVLIIAGVLLAAGAAALLLIPA